MSNSKRTHGPRPLFCDTSTNPVLKTEILHGEMVLFIHLFLFCNHVDPLLTYTHTFTHVHTCVYTSTHMCIHVHTHVQVRTHIHIRVPPPLFFRSTFTSTIRRRSSRSFFRRSTPPKPSPPPSGKIGLLGGNTSNRSPFSQSYVPLDTPCTGQNLYLEYNPSVPSPSQIPV